jgi:hypothetical protein
MLHQSPQSCKYSSHALPKEGIPANWVTIKPSIRK